MAAFFNNAWRSLIVALALGFFMLVTVFFATKVGFILRVSNSVGAGDVAFAFRAIESAKSTLHNILGRRVVAGWWSGD